jgi:hypothetical protein
MAMRALADQEVEALRSFPAIGKDELIRYVTLNPADGGSCGSSCVPRLFWAPRCSRAVAGPCRMRSLLFRRQLGLPVEVLRGYGLSRQQACAEHLRQGRSIRGSGR